MPVSNPETLDKVVDFLEMSNHENFSISPMFFRSFEGCMKTACGACCKKLSLNYLDGSERWNRFKKNYPDKVKDFSLREFKGAKFWTNQQEDNTDNYCMYLNKENGLCTVHAEHSHPLSCDLPFVKFSPRTHPKDPDKNKTLLTSMPYGRPHTFKRMDGGIGAMCHSTPFDIQQTLDDIDKLRELVDHGKAMSIDTKQLEEAIDLVEKDILPKISEDTSLIPKEAILIGPGKNKNS